MPSLTVENYLKALLQVGMRTANEWVATGQLANELSVSPGTVTCMLKSLAEADVPLVEYKPYTGVRLSVEGRTIALRILRRHRLLELFLVRTLELSWDEVHEEAENMEHAVSDTLVDRIDEYLGHPEIDPHGDPIPTVDGVMRSSSEDAIAVTACQPATEIELVRVVNQGKSFLRLLSKSHIEIGSTGVVLANNPEAEMIELQFGNEKIALGHQVAQSLLVRSQGQSKHDSQASSEL